MRYKDVITHPVLSKLIAVQFLSYFGSFFSFVAISTLLIELSLTKLQIGIVLAMYFLPSMILSPINGYIIDRFKFKKLVLYFLTTEMIMTLMFTTIHSKEQIYLLSAYIFMRSGAASLIFASEMSMLPKIIKGDILKKTNDIHSMIWSVSYAMGMALGGISMYLFGFKTTILADFALYILAFFIFLGIKININPNTNIDTPLKMIKDALLYIKNNKIIIHLMLIHSSIGLTVFDIIVTLLADAKYKYLIATSLSIGIINTSRAFALSIGPFIFGKYINKANLWMFFALQAITILIWANLQNDFYLSIFSIFFVGMITTSLWSYTYYLLQNEVLDKYLGRVLAYNDMIFNGVASVSTYLVGYFAKIGFELENITKFIGVLFLFVSLYTYRFVKKYYSVF
ncbi:MAG: MFS transporter [Sulfurovaceae bacterium]|nr:MFS transporter [Sulfurovaceae bacterium]